MRWPEVSAVLSTVHRESGGKTAALHATTFGYQF